MPLEWRGRDEKFFLAVRYVWVSIQWPSFPRPPAPPHILLLDKVGLWPSLAVLEHPISMS